MKNYICLFAVMLLAIAPLAFAQDDAVKQAKGEAMTARTAHLICAVDLSKAHLDVLAKYYQQDIAKLKSDLETSLASLKEAATADDQKKFDESAKAVADSVKGVKEAVNKARRDEKGPVKAEDSKVRKDELKKAHEEFAECQSTALKDVARAHEKVANSQIEALQKKADELKAEGADTAGLQNAIDAAKAKRDKLKKDSESGDAKKITESLKELRNQRLHAHANIAVAKLSKTITKAEEKAKQKGVSVDFSKARAELEKASSLATPGKEYAKGEYVAVWDSLKEASKNVKDSLKDARKTARDEKKEEAQAKREEIKAERQEIKAERQEKKDEAKAERLEKAEKASPDSKPAAEE